MGLVLLNWKKTLRFTGIINIRKRERHLPWLSAAPGPHRLVYVSLGLPRHPKLSVPHTLFPNIFILGQHPRGLPALDLPSLELEIRDGDTDINGLLDRVSSTSEVKPKSNAPTVWGSLRGQDVITASTTQLGRRLPFIGQLTSVWLLSYQGNKQLVLILQSPSA